MSSRGRCRLLAACCAADEDPPTACLTEHAAVVSGDVCKTLHASQSRASWAVRPRTGAVPTWLPAQPLMFPPPANGGKPSGAPAGTSSSSRGGGSCCSSSRDGDGAPGEDSAADDDWPLQLLVPDDGAGVGLGASGAEGASQGDGWRRACGQHRAKACLDRALVRSVAGWGPQVGRLVDLHTGRQSLVTYWLRDDVKALCVFGREDTQVHIFPCSQVERCEAASVADEVVARQFFLGLQSRDLRRGVFVTMERFAQGLQVMQQGQMAPLRKQLLLLCSSSERRRELLGALRTLVDELLVHEHHSGSTCRTFCPVSDSDRTKDEADDRDPCGWPAGSSPSCPGGCDLANTRCDVGAERTARGD